MDSSRPRRRSGRSLPELDPQLPLADVRAMPERARDVAARRTFTLQIMVGFATAALVLAIVGIYGVVNYAFTRRVRELAIRMAVGSTPLRNAGLVLGGGMRLVVSGILIGMAVAIAGTAALRSVAWAVPVAHPGVYVVAVALVATVALAACCFPARRAARLSPADALKMTDGMAAVTVSCACLRTRCAATAHAQECR